jgi:hypothetical protein
MKSLVACLSLLILIQIVHAQNDRASQLFIRAVIHEKGIVYSDSLGGSTISDMKKYLNSKSVDSYILPGTRAGKSGKFGFTKREKQYINNEIKQMGSLCWQPGLLDSSRLIKTDTVTKIFKGGNLFAGWSYFRNNYGHDLYSFSKPIFLRNNTICLFYFGSSCGHLCGGGGLYIYVRENGVWKMKYPVYTWVS